MKLKNTNNLFYIFLTLVLLDTTSKTSAQVYILNKTFTNGDVISACSGTFYGSGDSTLGYGTNEDYTVTFTPSLSGLRLQLRFDFLGIDYVGADTLFVYDGTSTSSVCLKYVIQGNLSLGTGFAMSTIYASDTNSTGSITFRFVSDGFSDGGQGWKANIQCVPTCSQPILGSINFQQQPTGCPTGSFLFTATTSYPSNDQRYHQSDTGSYFHWFFGDGKDTVQKGLTQVQHTYTANGGYDAYLIITDSNKCINQQPIQAQVRTGLKPIFALAANNPSICVGDTARLYPVIGAMAGTGGAAQSVPSSIGSQVPIARPRPTSLEAYNGTGKTFQSRISVNQFAPNQKLTNINDLLGIVVNIEFFYVTDIEMTITAPNGARVMLINFFDYRNGSASLGEPVYSSSSQLPGKGYNYIFNSSPQYATMFAEVGSHTHSYKDNSGAFITNASYLPSGSYATSSPLSALLGTPINGIWTLSFNNNRYLTGSQKKGNIFYWYLNFKPSIFPAPQTYTVPISSQLWQQPATGLVTTNGTMATVIPPSAGNWPYTYRVTDSFGCVYDTTVTITARQTPNHPQLGNDMALCSSQPMALLQVASPQASTFYKWSDNVSGPTNYALSPGSYSVTATNQFGCTASDTINVVEFEQASIGLSDNLQYCATSSTAAILTSNLPNGLPVTYLWNTGATTPSIPITNAGTYWLQATAANGCMASDTAMVASNPLNAIPHLADTTICEGSSYVKSISLPFNTSILWNDGNTNAIRTITAPTNYSFTLNNAGCTKALGFSTSTKPIPVINLGNDEFLCIGTPITKTVHFPNANYLWSTGSIDTSITITQQGTYWAEASLNGCSFRDSMEVKYLVCDCQTILPNAFSPNGDGINDGFRPIMQCPVANLINYSMAIFNRNGQQVFETRNAQEEWKGTINGRPVPIGTYYCIVTYFNKALNKQERFAGSVTVLR